MDYSCARAFYLNKNRDIENIILRDVYVYVNECYQVTYHIFMFDGFKSGSHIENNKIPLVLLLHNLSS